MAISNFVPEFWSTRLRRFLDASLVYAQPTVMNRNWEGDIQEAGDTVHIQKVSDGATVKNYSRNTDMDAPQRPDGDTLALEITEEKYTNSAIDDVDAVQVNVPLFDQWAQRTARNIRKVMDTYAATLILAGVDADNVIGSDAVPVDVALTGGDYTAYQFAVECRRLLNAQDAPEEGRWMVINEDLEATFLQDDFYVAIAGPETRSGQIGRVAGFDILRTTAVPKSATAGGSIKVLFGAGNYALTWADQLVKMEAYRIERQFGDAVKTLNVYGAKVVEPESIGVGHVVSPGAS